MALGDVDGDTDLDAVVVTLGGPDTVWLNQGGIQAGTPGIFVDSGQSPGSSSGPAVSLGDVDDDGDLDALVGAFGDNILWLNQGGIQGGTAGVFAQGDTLGNSLDNDVVLAHLNGDSALDAFFAGYGPDQV